MTKSSQLLVNQKSPTLIVGLFCLFLLVGCSRPDNPDDVAIAFWTAVSESDLDRVRYYSNQEPDPAFNDRLRNSSLQIGKVKYVCNGATVDTRITRESGAGSSIFRTFLVRSEEEDRWIVDYQRTLDHAADKDFKNIITTLKENGKKIKPGVFFKELWQAIVTVFKNLKDRLLHKDYG